MVSLQALQATSTMIRASRGRSRHLAAQTVAGHCLDDVPLKVLLMWPSLWAEVWIGDFPGCNCSSKMLWFSYL